MSNNKVNKYSKTYPLSMLLLDITPTPLTHQLQIILAKTLIFYKPDLATCRSNFNLLKNLLNPTQFTSLLQALQTTPWNHCGVNDNDIIEEIHKHIKPHIPQPLSSKPTISPNPTPISVSFNHPPILPLIPLNFIIRHYQQHQYHTNPSLFDSISSYSKPNTLRNAPQLTYRTSISRTFLNTNILRKDYFIVK